MPYPSGAVTVKTSAAVAGGSGNTGWAAASLWRAIDKAYAPDFSTAPWVGSAVGRSTTSNEFSQSFTTPAGITVDRIGIVLGKAASPTDNLTMEIQTDASGLPSGTVVTNGTSNAIANTAILASLHIHEFIFPNQPVLSASTRYHWVLKRSGSLDDTNFYSPAIVASVLAGESSATRLSGTWTAHGSGADSPFYIASPNAGSSLYMLVQDASLHVFRSTDNGQSWSEQDSGDAVAVNSSTKPFSAFLNPLGNVLLCGYFSNTNTCRVRKFDCPTNQWGADLGGGDAGTIFDFNRQIRVGMNGGQTCIFGTASADDADLTGRQWNGASWATASILNVTHADASSFLDMSSDLYTSSLLTMYWQDVATSTVKVQTLSGGSFGTATNIDATAADSETEHASANYEIAFDGATTSRVIVAFIDADGTLEERILTLGVTAASISQATQHQVSSSTSYAGRQLATCVYNGDGYIFACTGSGIDIFKDTGLAGTWSSAVNWKSGLTNCFLSRVIAIPGFGIVVSYNDNGNVKVDGYMTSELATVASGALAIGGQSVAARSGSIGAVATGARAITGQTVNADPHMLGSVATGGYVVSGQSVAGRSGSVGQVNTGSRAVTGQSVAGRAGGIGSVAAGGYAVSGQAIAGRSGSIGSIATGSHVVSGQAVAGRGAGVGSVSTGAFAIFGQSVGAIAAAVGLVNTGAYAVTGQTVTGTAGAALGDSGTVSAGVLSVGGQTIAARGGVLASVATNPYSVSGQAIAAAAGSVGAVASGSHAVTGQAVAGRSGSVGAVAGGVHQVAGQAVNADPHALGAVANGPYTVAGQTIAARTGADADIATGGHVVAGQAVNARSGASGAVSNGSLTVNGQTVAAMAGTNATVATGNLAVDDQTIVSGVGAAATISTGQHAVVGQTVQVSAGAVGLVNAGSLDLEGQTVFVPTVDGDQATVTVGTLTVAGQSIAGRAGSGAVITTGQHSVVGSAVAAIAGSRGIVGTGAHQVDGQPVGGNVGAYGGIGTGAYAVVGQPVAGLPGAGGIIAAGALAVLSDPIGAIYGSVAIVGSGVLMVEGGEVVVSGEYFPDRPAGSAAWSSGLPGATFAGDVPAVSVNGAGPTAQHVDRLPVAGWRKR